MQTLRNVTEYLSLAKTINVTRIVLPSDVMDGIDKLNVDLNTAADTLSEKTDENSVKIRRVFNDVYVIIKLIPESYSPSMYDDTKPCTFCRRLALYVVAAVMLLLALVGLGIC